MDAAGKQCIVDQPRLNNAITSASRNALSGSFKCAIGGYVYTEDSAGACNAQVELLAAGLEGMIDGT